MPALTVDYYFAPHSPWTYLGHARFLRIAAASGATVRFKPVDLGRVFPVSGGLPLAQRAPQRQAYRLVELARWRDHLGLPLNLQPRHFPVNVALSLKLLVAVDQADGTAAALALGGQMGRAVWVEERDLSDPAALALLLAESGLPQERLAQAADDSVAERCAAHTQDAIDAGVFGAPSYVIDGEIFWGQDRLDFVERRLSSAAR